MTRRAWLVATASVAMASTGFVPAAFAAGKAAQVAEVGVVTIKKQAVPRFLTLPGRAVAYQQASITPRVGGIITKILYTPGKKLQAGDPLFQLDDATYAATVASDQAAVDKAAAAIPTDQANYDRAVKLQGEGYTAAQVATYKSTLEEDKASLASAQAALNFAKIQLGWTTIRSPIEGYADVPAVTVGNLVTAAQSTALTTVTRLDPVDVDVLEPSADILSIRNMIDTGVMTPDKKLEAKLTLDDGQVYTGLGSFVAPSSSVSTSTGTVSFRFRFENPDRKILPGMFLRAQVKLGTMQGFLVPQSATQLGTDGKLTAFVVENGKATQVSFDEIGNYQNQWIVTSGLSDGQQMIVDGLKYMSAGRPVKAVPAKIDADGNVEREQGTSGSTDASSTSGSSN